MNRAKGMKISYKDVAKTLITRLSRVMKSDSGAEKVITFGDGNDYPETFEALINNSIAAGANVEVVKKFFIGEGFVDESINNEVVGTDSRGKKITMLSFLENTVDSLARNNGYYWHSNYKPNLDVFKVESTTAHVVDFKECRFPKQDDSGYSAKIWKRKGGWADKNNKEKALSYFVFNQNEDSLKKQMGDKKYAFKGQIFFSFLDNRYTYPLNPFDAAYLELDTDYQVPLYQNNSIVNGTTDKTIIRIAPSEEEDEALRDKEDSKNEQAAHDMMGADGSNTMVILDPSLNEEGGVAAKSGALFETAKTSINANLFEKWETSRKENIRLSSWNVPDVFLTNKTTSLGVNSGAYIQQMTNYYNAYTLPIRKKISQDLKEFFKNSNNEKLRNANFEIKPLSLFNQENQNNGSDIDTNTATVN